MNLSMLLSDAYSKITTDHMWANNVQLTQSLSLCPLLTVTGATSYGLGLDFSRAHTSDEHLHK